MRPDETSKSPSCPFEGPSNSTAKEAAGPTASPRALLSKGFFSPPSRQRTSAQFTL
jgi:hypothetical protein